MVATVTAEMEEAERHTEAILQLPVRDNASVATLNKSNSDTDLAGFAALFDEGVETTNTKSDDLDLHHSECDETNVFDGESFDEDDISKLFESEEEAYKFLDEHFDSDDLPNLFDCNGKYANRVYECKDTNNESIDYKNSDETYSDSDSDLGFHLFSDTEDEVDNKNATTNKKSRSTPSRTKTRKKASKSPQKPLNRNQPKPKVERNYTTYTQADYYSVETIGLINRLLFTRTSTHTCNTDCVNCGMGTSVSQEHEEEESTTNRSSDMHRARSEEDTCCICLDTHTDPKVLPKCSHKFCRECIDAQFKIKPVCPVCFTPYGIITGIQPEGEMKDYLEPSIHLPGYEPYGTIVIAYSFPSGTQTSEHPHPGVAYSGTSRVGYLPDSPEGRKVLRLLKESFRRRLTFTVGRSRTTGADNTVTWNDIHHKTATCGGMESFGYPDPTYLSRVQEELAAFGVTEESLNSVASCNLSF